MIEITHDEVEDKEFNPTFEDEQTENDEFASAGEQTEEEPTEDMEEEPTEDSLAPIVEMNPTAQNSTEQKPNEQKTISEMFGGIATFIEVGLQEVAKEDEDVKASLSKENKSLDECLKYIIGEVQQRVFSGNYGTKISISNDEHGADLLELAIYYYENDDATPRGMFAPKPQPKPKEPKEKKEKPKKEQGKKKPAVKEQPKIDVSTLELPKKPTEEPKVFSGFKKGSKAYNEAVYNSLQGDLFGDMFNDNNEDNNETKE